ncbi:hypothetical protein QOT17_001295 [Balamuthia mandrillaris]
MGHGWLSNSVLQLQKLPTTAKWTESPILYLHSDGGQWLLGLLQSNKAAHGLPEDIVIDEEPVIMNELQAARRCLYSGQYKVIMKRKGDNIEHLAEIPHADMDPQGSLCSVLCRFVGEGKVPTHLLTTKPTNASTISGGSCLEIFDTDVADQTIVHKAVRDELEVKFGVDGAEGRVTLKK